MRIQVAGVLHDDPLMHLPLRDWMLSLKNMYDEPPAFVAVEWYPAVLGQFCEAWDEFVELALRDWRCPDQSVAEQAADAIAYEATAAAITFGVDKVWWMNAEREYQHLGREVYSWHSWRLMRRNEGRRCPTIAKLSVLARLAAQDAARNTARDQYLAEQVLTAAEQMGGHWGIAVVGALHASARWADTTLSLLQAAGHTCEPPIFFGWKP